MQTAADPGRAHFRVEFVRLPLRVFLRACIQALQAAFSPSALCHHRLMETNGLSHYEAHLRERAAWDKVKNALPGSDGFDRELWIEWVRAAEAMAIEAELTPASQWGGL